MDKVFDIFEQINEAKGKAKQAVIKEHGDNALFRKVLFQCLNKRITFGVGRKTIDSVESRADGFGAIPACEKAFVQLDALSKREITGSEAESLLCTFKETYCEKSWDVLKRILLKTSKCGITAKTVNSVFKKEIPVFQAMLAQKYEAKRIKSWPVNVEIKHDGVRAVAIVDSAAKSVEILSREGNEFKVFDHVKEQLLQMVSVFKKTDTFIFDGEMISGLFNETAGEIHKKNHQSKDSVFHVFEILNEAEFYEGSTVDQFGRRSRLEKLFGVCERNKISHPHVALMHSFQAHDDKQVQDYFSQFYSQGHEGLIIKPLEHIYEPKRSWGFMKIKGEESEDLFVVDMEEGEKEKKYEGMLGALVVDFKGVKVRVASGLSDQQRVDFWNNKEEVIGRLIEVEYHEVTPDGSLRHPRFKKFRDTVKKGCKE